MKFYYPLYVFAFMLAIMGFIGQLYQPNSIWAVILLPAGILAIIAAVFGQDS